MTVPLMALAVGAIVAGFVSIPPALGGGAMLEHFLEPSFTAQQPRRTLLKRPRRLPPSAAAEATAAEAAHEEPHISHVGRARPDGVLGDDRADRHL